MEMHAIQSKQASMSSGCIVPPGSNPFRRSPVPLAAILPVFSRRFQFPMPVDLNLLMASRQHILRRDIADGTVQADVVVGFLHRLPHVPTSFHSSLKARNGSIREARRAGR
jgi:hypothetical protein